MRVVVFELIVVIIVFFNYDEIKKQIKIVFIHSHWTSYYHECFNEPCN